MKIPATIRFRPDAPGLQEELARFKKTSGAYVLRFHRAPPHISWSTNLERRLKRLLLPGVSGGNGSKDRLREQIESVECWPTGSRLELNLLLYGVAKELYPADYLTFLKLRSPWFVAIMDASIFPRLEITNRLLAHAEVHWGPFLSRSAAQQYEQELLGLFQIRRCVETLVPSPEHPGCMYGEMNQCLRPCQTAVSVVEYGSEALRVSSFLETNGKSAIAALASARDRACEGMDFEQAAQMHKRIEKMKTVASLRAPVITRITQLNGLALTRSAETERFVLWPLIQGYWQEPVTLEFLTEAPRTKSLDSEIRELLSERLAQTDLQGHRGEHIALFSRWYYSSWRDGQWFPFGSLADLNYRKLVRELSKMAQARPVLADCRH